MSGPQQTQRQNEQPVAAAGDCPRWVESLFETIDAQNLDAFLEHLDDDVMFRFGNAEALAGKAAVGPAVAGFFESIHSLEHTLLNTWQSSGSLVCHGSTRYVRHDGSDVTVPFANVFYLADNGKVREYLIHVDLAPLYA